MTNLPPVLLPFPVSVTYVSNIYQYYVAYKLIALQQEQREKAKESIQQKPAN